MKILKRSFNLETRDNDQAIEGFCFRFNEVINFMGQDEKFSPELKVKEGPFGTFLLRAHDDRLILGKSGENLTFETTSEGLKFMSKKIDTELWRETRELIKQKILRGVSVGFRSLKEELQGKVLIYKEIALHEISLLIAPAYESSSLAARQRKNKTLKNKDLPPECFQ